MAEVVTLNKLGNFLIDLNNIYEKGAKILILMDGRIFCDLYDNIKDDNCTIYN
jgi:pyoverdine/dityrosine biosynthesis protein Dit1